MPVPLPVDDAAAISRTGAGPWHGVPSTPRRIDPYARGQQVYEAVRGLIRDGGIEAVTIRAVAARADLASSSLRQQYRDKDFLLRCVIHECTVRLSRATYRFSLVGYRARRRRPVHRLPRSDDERENGRLWLALAERSRSADDDTRGVIRAQRDDWTAMARNALRHLGAPPSVHDIEATRLALLLEACLAAVCDPTQPLDHDGALNILRLHARQLETGAAAE